MNDKKEYAQVEIEVCYFQESDVITASISASYDKGEDDIFD